MVQASGLSATAGEEEALGQRVRRPSQGATDSSACSWASPARRPLSLVVGASVGVSAWGLGAIATGKIFRISVSV